MSAHVGDATLFPRAEDAKQGHGECIYGIALTSTLLITASRDQSVRVWSLATQELVHPPLQGHTAAVLCVFALEPLGVFFSGSVDKRVIAWNLSTLEKVKTLEGAHSESVLSVAASRSFLATGSKDKTIKIWRIADVMEREADPSAAAAHLTGHAAAVNKVVMTESLLASGSGDRTIRLWDVKTWQCVRRISGHQMGVAALALSPDGGSLVSASSDRTARIWDVATGEEMACLRAHDNLVRSVCLVPGRWGEDSQMVLTGGYDETVIVWRRAPPGEWVAARYNVRHIVGGEGSRRVFALLSDGEQVFCASQAEAAAAWKLPE